MISDEGPAGAPWQCRRAVLRRSL